MKHRGSNASSFKTLTVLMMVLAPLSIVATLMLATLPSVGATLDLESAVQVVNFAGHYSDPNHPNCLREILVVAHHPDAPQATIRGTDGNPGCPPNGSGSPWTLTGTIQDDTILIDFSPKGGPKDLLGTWVNLPTPGIRFPDGNMWTKTGDSTLGGVETH